MMDVTAVGELLVDLTAEGTNGEGYPVLSAHPGGAPCNFLAALSKYGVGTAFLGKVGQDMFGDLLVGTLKAAGINTAGIVQDPAVFTTMAFVALDEKGERRFSFARKPGADTRLRFDECDLSLVDRAGVFHFGTLSLTDEPARDATRRLAAYARERGKWITFDPNLRLPLWEDLERARAEILWGLSAADVVKLSDDEADFLWGCAPEEAARKLLDEYAVKLAFVTLGAKGCVYANRLGMGRAVSAAQVQVVDTTGAGDIFGGSALSRLLALGRAPEDVPPEELSAIAAFACTAATLSTRSHGGISSVPPMDEVLGFLK